MSNLNFNNIRIDRYLGIGRTEQAIELEDLVRGLNVIWAKNGRGKTCTARAMIGILWGQGLDPHRDEIEARIEGDGITAEQSTRPGSFKPITNLPPADISGLYRMSLPELLEGRDEDLVERIRYELHGNIDLKAAANTLEFVHAALGRNTRECRQTLQTREELRETTKEQQDVEQDRQSLDQLRRKYDEIKNEISLKECYQQKLELKNAEEALQAAEAELKFFPDGIDNLRSGDSSEFDGLLDDLRGIEDGISEKRCSLEEAKEKLADTGFAEKEPPDTPWKETAKGRVEELRDAESHLESCQDKLRDVKIRKDNAQSALDDTNQRIEDLKGGFLHAPEQAKLDAINSLHEDWSILKREYEELEVQNSAQNGKVQSLKDQITPMINAEGLEHWLEHDMPIPDFSGAIEQAVAVGTAKERATDAEREFRKLAESSGRVKDQSENSNQAIELLRRYLLEQSANKPKQIAWPLLAAVTGLPAILCIVLGISLSPLWFAALLLPLALGVFLKYHDRGSVSADTDNIRREFVKSDIDPSPSSWQASNVIECIQEHQKRLVEYETAKTAADRSHERKDAAQQKLDELISAQKVKELELAEKLNLRLEDWDAGQLSQLVGLLKDLRESKNEKDRLSSRLKEKQGRMEEFKESLKQNLGEFFAEPGEEISELVEQISRLKNAIDELTRLQASLDTQSDNLNAAKLEVSKAETEMENADDRKTNSLNSLHKHLEGWHEDPPSLTDSTLAGPAVGDIITRAEEHDRLCLEISRLEREIKVSEGRLASKVTQIDGWLNTRCLPSGKDNWEESCRQLADRLDQLDDYNVKKGEKDNALSRIGIAKQRLESEECPSKIADLKKHELEQWLSAVEKRQETLDKLQKKIAGIEKEIHNTQEDDALEIANAKHQEALSALSYRRDLARAASIGALLVEDLETRTGLADSPALAGAQNFFAAFTKDRYRLDVSGASSEIAARDQSRGGRRIPIEELSSGTRVQLLLAARLGFLSAQEGGVYNRPPFLLDEALAVSDYERSAAIMDAVYELIAEGRQVFYFTAQPEEVDHWRAHADEKGEDLFHLHTIGTPPQQPTEPVARWQPASIPKPEERESYADYGVRLKVPPIDPWIADAVAAAHPWYVNDDPSLLNRCLRIAGTSCGALMAYLDRVGLNEAAVQLGCKEADLEKIRRHYAMVERTLEYYRRQRPRPLKQDDLEEIKELPRFGDAVIEDLAELIRKEEGNAAVILQRSANLQGFGSKRKDTMREYLAENGFIDTGEPYTGDEVTHLLRQEFGDGKDVDEIIECSRLFVTSN